MNNIILIGMPGAGKSTIGVILAKVLGKSFVDSDLLIQKRENRLLHEIIEDDGMEGFLAIENKVNREIRLQDTVIATGGSVVYCSEAMEHLKTIGTIVYIQLGLETIKNRLGNIKQRGVVLKDGETLDSLYAERCPLYEQYADIVLNAEGLGVEDTMDRIVGQLIDVAD